MKDERNRIKDKGNTLQRSNEDFIETDMIPVFFGDKNKGRIKG